MKIRQTFEIDCPAGFYCKKGRSKCSKINYQNGLSYCELSNLFLDKDSKGNIIKCDKCLLAEKRARQEM